MRYSINVTKRQRESIPLLLRSVGISHLQEPVRRPNGFPLWQIFYCVSGRGEFRLGDGKAVLNPGQIAILEPHLPHRYQSTGEDWTVHYVGFDGEACIRILNCLRLGEQGIYSLSSPDLFLSRLTALQEFASAPKPQHTLCSIELYSLLLDLSGGVRRLPMSQAAKESEVVREIILYLEDHYARDLSLDDLSAQFHRTPEYLCTVFRGVTGETIMHYLRGIRLHHAKILLMDAPDLGIKEIAGSCGFASASYFGRVFRESTGYTPQGYRLGIRVSP